MQQSAGWYPDPQQPHLLRWWDGYRWTQHTRQHSGQNSTEPAHEANTPTSAGPNEPTDGGSEIDRARSELAALRSEIIEVRDVMLLQEVGIYQYIHPLDSAAAYKTKLKKLRTQIEALAKAGDAVKGSTSWAINGSLKEGAKMVSDFSKLLLRAYNNEAETAVRSMRPHSLTSACKRLEQSKSTISRLGTMMQLMIADAYHDLRKEELQLTADYLAKLAEEKDRNREERARLRQEKIAQKELDREREKLDKEITHYETALAALQEKGDSAGVQRMEEKLQEIRKAVDGVTERAANIRAGYVYVLSNTGAFGHEIVKIGMTRRVDPMDRVRELGDASVPFRFDVHALVFSSDAVGLETRLHQRFSKDRVNLVNLRREYFYATPRDVKEALLEECPNLLTYVEEPVAEEYRQSCAARGHIPSMPPPRLLSTEPSIGEASGAAL